MVPRLEDPPLIPFTLQLTPVADVPVTVAMNCFKEPRERLIVAGERLTDMVLTAAPDPVMVIDFWPCRLSAVVNVAV
jgi:hypothetical protein